MLRGLKNTLRLLVVISFMSVTVTAVPQAAQAQESDCTEGSAANGYPEGHFDPFTYNYVVSINEFDYNQWTYEMYIQSKNMYYQGFFKPDDPWDYTPSGANGSFTMTQHKFEEMARSSNTFDIKINQGPEASSVTYRDANWNTLLQTSFTFSENQKFTSFSKVAHGDWNLTRRTEPCTGHETGTQVPLIL